MQMTLNVFGKREQQQLIDENLAAWTAVCGILLTIICLGVFIAFFLLFVINV